MGTTNLLIDGDNAQYKVQDLIADIFDVEINDEAAEKILTMYPNWKGKTGLNAVMGLADDICYNFVGRGIPWHKEAISEEQNFWCQLKNQRENFVSNFCA